MTEPQVWTMMGVFTAFMFGTLTAVSTLFVRVVRAEIGGLRGEMNARFDAVNARFDATERRIESIDRDVQALVKRTFGMDRE